MEKYFSKAFPIPPTPRTTQSAFLTPLQSQEELGKL
jgi:hypothetical protein